ncbi:Uncharacterised protein [Klebsiella pneumoniae]|nr:hypothetical protein BvCmsSIP076_02428 [Escherichia coli]SWT26323.1 Uncharacterised protein [Klebsiella pneumoniae]
MFTSINFTTVINRQELITAISAVNAHKEGPCIYLTTFAAYIPLRISQTTGALNMNFAAIGDIKIALIMSHA